MSFKIPLPLPKLLDLTDNNGEDFGYVKIITTQHRFSKDALKSGTDPINFPIFGSVYNLRRKEKSYLSFGLPFFKFKRGQKVNLLFKNKTGFSFDLHWHGLNTIADLDGASTELEFGVSTKLGTNLQLNFPKITNNSALLWVHAHPMFVSSEFISSGVYGLVNIVDDQTKFIDDTFKYGDNHLMMVYQDVEFNSDGTLNKQNLYTDAERSNFGLINGIGCVNWYSKHSVKYATSMHHYCNKNLLKIDILNGSYSFRNIYIGICDKKDNIKPFHLIQGDNGLVNPVELDMLNIGPANRVSILIDLKKFDDDIAYLFLYNFDLTEVFDINLNTNDPANVYLQANVPDFQKSSNPTPNPTPIPDPVEHLTNLTYPKVAKIPQINQPVPCGKQIPPQKLNLPFTKKKFLEIKLNKKSSYENLGAILKNIKKTVFGKNYYIFKELINQNNFEFNNQFGINYISLLNEKYFYNLPNLYEAPTRNFIFFPDNSVNSIVSNPNGATEFINGANRIVVDLWNSEELDFSYALSQYNLSPNNFQPKILPTCLFRIFPSNEQFINYNMLANDTLTIQFFTKRISYGDKVTTPISEVTIIFPPINIPININQWKNLVNSKLNETVIKLGKKKSFLSCFLNYDWTFYPYSVSYLTEKTQYVKSVLIKTDNFSNYYVRLIGNWQLLQFFGKPIAADMVNMDDLMNTMNDNQMSMFKNNYNMNIQSIYPQYATSDPENPITSIDGNAELIIAPKSTYYGPIDGFQNDSLMNFSVQLNGSEKWNYHNLDTQDSHPFHFHLTSGFVDTSSPLNSPCLLVDSNYYTPYLYSKDTYSIGSQQSISFYLKFPNYQSAQGSLKSPIKYLGYMYHCHYLTHHDMNMMGEYFVYENRNDYF